MIKQNLERYLEEMAHCPDALLTEKCGVYQNFPIFLNIEFETLVENLRSSEKYTQLGQDKSEKKYYFDFISGTAELTIVGWIPPMYTRGNSEEKDKQKNEFKSAILLNPYQKKRMENTDDMRAMAIVIKDIGEYALRNNIDICMTFWGNRRNREILYYGGEK